MSRQIKRFYEFGVYQIDTVNRRLLCNGEAVPLKAKAVDTLLLLIQHNGEVVEKDELMNQLWPDSFVEEANLTQNIYILRKALGAGEYIETVPRRGYRFAAEVKEWDESSDLIVIKEKTSRSLSYEEEFEQAPAEVRPDNTRAENQRLLDVTPHGATSRSIDIRPSFRSRNLSRLWPIPVSIGGLIMIAAVFLWVRSPAQPFHKTELVRFTTSGKAEKAAISPDGKYLAYLLGDSAQGSVWLRQVATGKDLQIIPPTRAEFYGLTFSHDGNYIYYVNQEMNHLGMLFQIPSLGGPSNKLAEDVDSPVTVSPDDKRVAFIRDSPTERSIIIVNVDGSGERKLSSTSATADFRIEPTYLVPPAWSPDGKIMACPVGITTSEDEYQTIWGFRTDTGAPDRAVTSERWQTLGRMEWLAAGNGLVVAAAEKGGNFGQQIWYVSYPDGTARKITNDLNDYRDLSLTADAKTIIAVQSERRANIWVAPANDLDHPRQLTFTNYDALDGLSWTPDGKLVYTQQSVGEQNLWLTDLSGKNAIQLTKHAGFNLEPAVSPDSRYIVFTSSRSGRLHIWRIDVDGKHPLELTHGSEDRRASLTPDSQSLLFRASVRGAGGRVFRVPIEGGNLVRLTDKITSEPVVSPDGKSFALIYRAAPAAINQIAIMSIEGGEPHLIRDLPAHYGRFHWTTDGSALAYADKAEGVGNIWIQPLDGSPPRQLTHWLPDPILSFDWSRDGKWLAYASGTLTSDVVRISDAR
jgi:Tol biopolymer transport system component/DNA-binding winged helix-turn-helix (wHTH) protein